MAAAPPRAEYELALSATQRAFVEDPHRWCLFLGGVGGGKSYAGAVRSLYRFGARPGPQLGIVVAPTYPILRDATLRTALDVWAPLVDHVVRNEMRVVLKTGDEVLFRSADDPEHLRGPNASWAWLDEGAICHPATWPITIARLRQHGVTGDAWVTTTPRGLNWVYEVFVVAASDETALHRAATWANPFVDPSFVAALRGQYDGAFARQELEAEFIADEAGALLEWRWLEAARRPSPTPTPGVGVQAGLDVAGPGDAETACCVRQGGDVLAVRAWSSPDPRGEVVAFLRGFPDLDAVMVDSAGIGHYFAAALEDAGLPVMRVNVGAAPVGTTKAEQARAAARFKNLRAQVFWSFREWADGGMLAGLTDPQTLGQLASLKYGHDPRGRVEIERKDDARKRGVRSPDRAEAVVLAFWQAPSTPFAAALAGAYGQAGRVSSSAPASPHPLAGDRSFQAILEKHGVTLDGDVRLSHG